MPTVEEITTRVKRAFGDESGAQITDADVIRWINDAQRELAVSNNLLQVKGTSALVAGTAEYSLPVGILVLRSVKYANIKLNAMNLQESDEFISGSPSPTGLPTHYWTWASKITVYPTPDASTIASKGANLTIYYTKQPTEVEVSGDIPEVPVQYHARIVEYCLAQAYELDDNMGSAQMKQAQFQQGSDKLRDLDTWNQDFYPHISVSAADTDGGEIYYNG